MCGANWTKIVASASDVTLRCYIAVIGVGRPEIDRWSLGVVYLCEVCYKYVDLIQLEWRQIYMVSAHQRLFAAFMGIRPNVGI